MKNSRTLKLARSWRSYMQTWLGIQSTHCFSTQIICHFYSKQPCYLRAKCKHNSWYEMNNGRIRSVASHLFRGCNARQRHVVSSCWNGKIILIWNDSMVKWHTLKTTRYWTANSNPNLVSLDTVLPISIDSSNLTDNSNIHT